jgi:cytochrome b
MTSLPAHDGNEAAESMIKVWDPFVRFFHWSLAILFTIAFVTEDLDMLLHVWSGYFIGLLLALRFVWGLIGPRHARFTDFIYRPSSIIGYMGDLLRLKGKRYIGHSPGGGAMVLALILAIRCDSGKWSLVIWPT